MFSSSTQDKVRKSLTLFSISSIYSGYKSVTNLTLSSKYFVDDNFHKLTNLFADLLLSTIHSATSTSTGTILSEPYSD
jgi:hypothetical protein